MLQRELAGQSFGIISLKKTVRSISDFFNEVNITACPVLKTTVDAKVKGCFTVELKKNLRIKGILGEFGDSGKINISRRVRSVNSTPSRRAAPY